MDTNIRKYCAFIAAVETGSFTRAGEKLFHTQSAVSRMISDLEKEWNVTLFERNRAGLRLTPEGQRLLAHARHLCEAHRNLQREVDAINGLQSGLIRIGTFSSVATHWLPSVIRAFGKDYPGIGFELLLGDYAEIGEWIIQGRVDGGFVWLPARLGLETLFLRQDRFLAILPEGHPLASCERVPLAALCNDPFILLEKGENTEVATIFSRCGLTPDVRFTLWDDYAIMSMVESGLGVAILPELILKRIPYRIVIRELDIPAFRNIGFALREKKTVPLAVRTFLDYLI